jgi:hypothetical protein
MPHVQIGGHGGQAEGGQHGNQLGHTENGQGQPDPGLPHHKPGPHKHDDAQDGEHARCKHTAQGSEARLRVVLLFCHSQKAVSSGTMGVFLIHDFVRINGTPDLNKVFAEAVGGLRDFLSCLNMIFLCAISARRLYFPCL